MQRHRIVVAVLAAIIVAATAGAAHAKADFVDIIAGRLGSPRPPCRICHIQGTTGPGSVQTPFGMSMLAHGMTGSRDSVLPALDAMAADGTDSDGDTVPDVTELSMNMDPNTPAPTPLTPSEPNPTYGCAVAVPPASGPASPVAALLAVFAVFLGALVTARARRPRGR